MGEKNTLQNKENCWAEASICCVKFKGFTRPLKVSESSFINLKDFLASFLIFLSSLVYVFRLRKRICSRLQAHSKHQKLIQNFMICFKAVRPKKDHLRLYGLFQGSKVLLKSTKLVLCSVVSLKAFSGIQKLIHDLKFKNF